MAPAAEVESARGNRGQGREPIYGQQSQEAFSGWLPISVLQSIAVAFHGSSIQWHSWVVKGCSKDCPKWPLYFPVATTLFARTPPPWAFGFDCVWLWGNKYTACNPRRPAWAVSVPNYLYVANIGQHTQQRAAGKAW